MTDTAVDRRSRRRTALQLLPVPDHDAGVLGRARHALDAEARAQRAEPALPSAGADAVAPAARAHAEVADPDETRRVAAPVTVVELAARPVARLVPRSLRHRSNARALRGGGGRRRGRGGGGLGARAASARWRRRDRLRRRSWSPSPNADVRRRRRARPPPADRRPPATDAVLAWIAALAAGRHRRRPGRPGPRVPGPLRLASRLHGRAHGAWRRATAPGRRATPDEMLMTLPSPERRGELVVVTLVGTVDQEGSPQHRADAFPVRVVDGVARSSPSRSPVSWRSWCRSRVPDGGRPPVVHCRRRAGGRRAPRRRRSDDPPRRRSDARLRRGRAGTELTQLEDAPGQRCSYRPDGRHRRRRPGAHGRVPGAGWRWASRPSPCCSRPPDLLTTATRCPKRRPSWTLVRRLH